MSVLVTGGLGFIGAKVVIQLLKRDIPVIVADNSKARKILKWNPKFNLYDMCKDGWNWICKNPYGYSSMSFS